MLKKKSPKYQIFTLYGLSMRTKHSYTSGTAEKVILSN